MLSFPVIDAMLIPFAATGTMRVEMLSSFVVSMLYVADVLSDSWLAGGAWCLRPDYWREGL